MERPQNRDPRNSRAAGGAARSVGREAKAAAPISPTGALSQGDAALTPEGGAHHRGRGLSPARGSQRRPTLHMWGGIPTRHSGPCRLRARQSVQAPGGPSSSPLLRGILMVRPGNRRAESDDSISMRRPCGRKNKKRQRTKTQLTPPKPTAA